MSISNAVVPAFGKPLRTPQYFDAVDRMIAVLRPHATLRIIAQHMQDAGFRTPANLDWTRMRVAAYIRNRKNQLPLTK